MDCRILKTDDHAIAHFTLNQESVDASITSENGNTEGDDRMVIDRFDDPNVVHISHSFDQELEFLSFNKTSLIINYDDPDETFEVEEYSQFAIDKASV